MDMSTLQGEACVCLPGAVPSLPGQRPSTLRNGPSTQLTGMQTLHDGRGVDEVAPTQGAHEVRVQLCDFDPCGPMHDVRKCGEGLGSVTLGSKCGIRNPEIHLSLSPKPFLSAFKADWVDAWAGSVRPPVGVHRVPRALEIHPTLSNNVRLHFERSRKGVRSDHRK